MSNHQLIFYCVNKERFFSGSVYNKVFVFSDTYDFFKVYRNSVMFEIVKCAEDFGYL